MELLMTSRGTGGIGPGGIGPGGIGPGGVVPFTSVTSKPPIPSAQKSLENAQELFLQKNRLTRPSKEFLQMPPETQKLLVKLARESGQPTDEIRIAEILRLKKTEKENEIASWERWLGPFTSFIASIIAFIVLAKKKSEQSQISTALSGLVVPSTKVIPQVWQQSTWDKIQCALKLIETRPYSSFTLEQVRKALQSECRTHFMAHLTDRTPLPDEYYLALKALEGIEAAEKLLAEESA
jgi:hypothetical protein